MSTIISSSPLPTLNSPQIEELQSSDVHNCYSAYKVILQAEKHAIWQKVDDNIVSARTLGYFLLEFHSQRHGIVGDKACRSLIDWIMRGQSDDAQHDVIFDIGKRCRDQFMRLCAFDYFYSQLTTYHCIQVRTSNTPLQCTLLTPIKCFLRLVGGYDKRRIGAHWKRLQDFQEECVCIMRLCFPVPDIQSGTGP